MIALALVLIAALQPAPDASKDAVELKELYRLEAVWNDAHVEGDADALDALWANDLIVTVGRWQVIAWHASPAAQ